MIRNTAAAMPAGSAFRSATVLKCCLLFKNAPNTVLPHPKTTKGAHNRNSVVSLCTSKVDFRNKPLAIHGAKNSIRIKTKKPPQRKRLRKLLTKSRYFVGVISFSRVTKSGTKLNLAPSRTTVSTNITTFNAVMSATAISLSPNRFGINKTRMRRLNPMPANVIPITQKVFNIPCG